MININKPTPAFPAVGILISKNEGNSAYEIIRFDTQRQLDRTRALTIAAIRIIETPEDTRDIWPAVLRTIYNTSRPDFPASSFPDTPESRELTVQLIHGLATPYEESTMSEDASKTTEQKEAKTKAEAKAQERAAAKQAKADAKAREKAEREAKRGNGVIGNIKQLLDTDKGVTVEEALDHLVSKFPDRTRDGMASTVKIQFSRLQKSTGRDIHNANIEGRGRVYKFADKGPVPGKVVEKQAAGAKGGAASTEGATTGGNAVEGAAAPAAKPAAKGNTNKAATK